MFYQFKSDFVLAKTVGSFWSHSGMWMTVSTRQEARGAAAELHGVASPAWGRRAEGEVPTPLYPRTSPASSLEMPTRCPSPSQENHWKHVHHFQPAAAHLRAVRANVINRARNVHMTFWNWKRTVQVWSSEKNGAILENFIQGLSVLRLRGFHQTETVS